MPVDLEYLKDAVPLETVVARYVDLKPVSGKMAGRCPFHADTNASFYVYPDGHYHCFGCQVRGDVLDFLQAMEGVDFKTALECLAKEAGVDLNAKRKSGHNPTSQAQRDVLDLSAGFFLSSRELVKSSPIHDYIFKRGLSQDVLDLFQIGYAPDGWQNLLSYLEEQGADLAAALDAGVVARSRTGRMYDFFRDRMIFPIHGPNGSVLGFGGRSISGQDPKYLNSPETDLFHKGSVLYGLRQSRPHIKKMRELFLVEGYMDVLALHQFGHPNALGYLGTAFTSGHVRLLRPFSGPRILIPDADAPGRNAALKALRLLLQDGSECFVMELPEGQDVDDVLRQPGGVDLFADIRAEAVPAVEFVGSELSKLSIKDRGQWLSSFFEETNPEVAMWLLPSFAEALGLHEFELRKLVHDAPGLFQAEERALSFLSSFPAYIPAFQAMVPDGFFSSALAYENWRLLQEGTIPSDLVRLDLSGVEVFEYWHTRIVPLLGGS